MLLTDEGISLVPLTAKHLEDCREWVNNPEVACGLLRYLPVSDFEHQEWYKSGKDRVYFAIESGAYVGNIGIREVDWQSRNGYLFVFIGNQTYWNKGVATAALNRFVKYCFDTLNLHKIKLRVLESNEAAVKVYEKCGFETEGTLKDDFYYGGKYHNIKIMGKTNV